MRIPFFRKKSAEIINIDELLAILGTGKISTDRVHRYILAQKLSDLVYSCITLIQAAAKTVSWYLYQRQGDETIEVEKGPLVDFLKRPGKRLSWSKFIDFYYAHLLLTGNVYIRQISPEFKTRIEVQFLRPDLVEPKKSSEDKIIYKYNGDVAVFSEEEILHISLTNPQYDDLHNLTGLSPIAPITLNIDIANYSKEWMFKLLENGAQPPLALWSDNPLTEEQREFLKTQLKKEYLGPENATKPLILEMMKPMKIGFSPKELEYDPIMKAMLRRIANVFHVPTELLGDVEYKTYSNAKEAVGALYHWAVLPHLASLKDELNWRLIPLFDTTGSMFFDFDVSGIEALSEDLNSLWQRVGQAVDRGIIHRNEAREELNFGASDEEGADKLTVASNVIPLDIVTGSGKEEE